MIAEAPTQTDLFDPEIVQRFEAWKETPGARKILQMAYALTAPYADTFQKTGQRVSIKLIWELLRYHVASNAGLEPENGYRLNNDFTPLLARHIVKHRPEWNGLFELRERKDGGCVRSTSRSGFVSRDGFVAAAAGLGDTAAVQERKHAE